MKSKNSNQSGIDSTGQRKESVLSAKQIDNLRLDINSSLNGLSTEEEKNKYKKDLCAAAEINIRTLTKFLKGDQVYGNSIDKIRAHRKDITLFYLKKMEASKLAALLKDSEYIIFEAVWSVPPSDESQAAILNCESKIKKLKIDFEKRKKEIDHASLDLKANMEESSRFDKKCEDLFVAIEKDDLNIFLNTVPSFMLSRENCNYNFICILICAVSLDKLFPERLDKDNINPVYMRLNDKRKWKA